MKHRKFDPRRFALGAVALAVSALFVPQAMALGLGRIQVGSALGETLRAEIEVTSMTPEEASTLNLRVASADTYRAAGVEYTPGLSEIRLVLTRRPNGQPVVRLTSERAMVEPFLEIIVEAGWASGRLVREYTVLLDPPPSVRQAAPVAPATPAVVAPPPATVPQRADQGAPSTAPSAVPAPTEPSAPRPAPRVAPRSAPAKPAASAAPEGQLQVRRGDTLFALASRARQPGVSLDQMLVAMFRGNPEAFAGGNMNRLKAGAVLTVPAAEAAAQITPAQARQTIVAQSADFSQYRQRLSTRVAEVDQPAASRQATGTVQADVSDRRQAAAPAPDKLKLTRPSGQASAPEAALSREGERKDVDSRIAELQRNIEELRKLQQSTRQSTVQAPATAPSPAPAAPATAASPVTKGVPLAVPVPPPVASAPAPAASKPAAAAASVPASAPTARPATPPPAPVEEPSLLDTVLESPYLPWAAGGLALLLAGAGAWRRLRQRKGEGSGETSFLESRAQPDSFFNVTGGQRVDTKEAAGGTPTSMSYSLSQLDAIGDVDPVAEADVYLAYGRDSQAEEILKEAMRANPDRLAVRTKLLEVYAKRRDIKGYELLASQLHALTKGQGEEWELAQAMGREIDPENPLYNPGGQPVVVVEDDAVSLEGFYAPTMPTPSPPAGAPVAAAVNPPVSLQEPPPPPSPLPTLSSPSFLPPVAAVQSVDLDLDLGLQEPSASQPPAEDAEPRLEVVEPAAPVIDLDLDEESTPTEPLPHPVAETVSTEPPPAMESLDFDLGDLDFPPAQAPAAPVSPATSPAFTLPSAPAEALPDPEPVADEDFVDFELPPAGALDQIDPGDPLLRKLELAEEFRQIGDTEGARDLLEEVIAKAEGALKAKAQGMLDGLE